MSTTTDQHVLRMSCQTATTIDLVWGITVPCLLFVGFVLNIVMCAGMACRREHSTSLVNFLVFHLSLVDVIFRAVTTVPWILLYMTDSTENSRVPCKALQTIDAMCGAAYFTTLLVIVWNYYHKISLRSEVQFSARGACGVATKVWVYAALCSCLMIISVSSEKYTEIPEVALNITEELRSCNIPKLCDLQRDWSGKFSSTCYFCLGFLFPMFAIVVLFVIIGKNAKRETLRRISTSQSHLLNQETPQNDPVYKADKNVRWMLILLSVFGALFLAPTSFIFMVRSYSLLDHISSDAVLFLVMIFEIFKFFNSLPNPFIFWWFMPSFRNKWCSACKCCKPFAKLVPSNNNYGTTTVAPMFTSDTAI